MKTKCLFFLFLFRFLYFLFWPQPIITDIGILANRNPNETPDSSKDISHNHNHIASPIEVNNKLTDTNDDHHNQKQKRQTNFLRRNKRTNHEVDRNDESGQSDEDLDEFDDNDDTHDSDESKIKDNRDRLDDTTDIHLPFWDTYDSINQLYLQIGTFSFFSFLLGFETFCGFVWAAQEASSRVERKTEPSSRQYLVLVSWKSRDLRESSFILFVHLFARFVGRGHEDAASKQITENDNSFLCNQNRMGWVFFNVNSPERV